MSEMSIIIYSIRVGKQYCNFNWLKFNKPNIILEFEFPNATAPKKKFNVFNDNLTEIQIR